MKKTDYYHPTNGPIQASFGAGGRCWIVGIPMDGLHGETDDYSLIATLHRMDEGGAKGTAMIIASNWRRSRVMLGRLKQCSVNHSASGPDAGPEFTENDVDAVFTLHAHADPPVAPGPSTLQ